MKPFASPFPSADYLPGLDGLRAGAIMIVLAAHMGFHHWIPGGFGVTLFFFISGMLITRLLLDEYTRQGHLNILQFYVRRLLRLYPALLVAIVLGTVTTLYTGQDIAIDKLFSALFYYINFYNIAHDFDMGFTGFDPFGILWSLAIEQQYYLLFPLVILPFMRNSRQLCLLLAASVIMVLAWRYWLVSHGADTKLIYMRTDTRIDSILYGALLTALLAQDTAGKWIATCSRWWVLPASTALLLSTFIIRDPYYRDTLRYSIQGLALMPILTIICFTSSHRWLTRLLEYRPLCLTGMWSYSLYLVHASVIAFAETIWGPASSGTTAISLQSHAGFIVTVLVLSYTLAMASYYGVEKPVMRLRKKFGSQQPPRT